MDFDLPVGSTVASNSGIEQWHRTVASNSGIEQWHRTVASNSGIEQWHRNTDPIREVCNVTCPARAQRE